MTELGNLCFSGTPRDKASRLGMDGGLKPNYPSDLKVSFGETTEKLVSRAA
jgi:hypothetical protein